VLVMAVLANTENIPVVEEKLVANITTEHLWTSTILVTLVKLV